MDHRRGNCPRASSGRLPIGRRFSMHSADFAKDSSIWNSCPNKSHCGDFSWEPCMGHSGVMVPVHIFPIRPLAPMRRNLDMRFDSGVPANSNLREWMSRISLGSVPGDTIPMSFREFARSLGKATAENRRSSARLASGVLQRGLSLHRPTTDFGRTNRINGFDSGFSGGQRKLHTMSGGNFPIEVGMPSSGTFVRCGRTSPHSRPMTCGWSCDLVHSTAARLIRWKC